MTTHLGSYVSALNKKVKNLAFALSGKLSQMQGFLGRSKL